MKKKVYTVRQPLQRAELPKLEMRRQALRIAAITPGRPLKRWDLATAETIVRMSAATILRALRAPDNIFPLKEKTDLAAKFVLRKMPQKIETDGQINFVRVYLPGSEDEREVIETASGIVKEIEQVKEKTDA